MCAVPHTLRHVKIIRVICDFDPPNANKHVEQTTENVDLLVTTKKSYKANTWENNNIQRFYQEL